MPAIHKFTYPNGKIYIGRDMLCPIQAAAGDQVLGYNIQKETLWEATSAHSSEVRRRQTDFILQYHANDPVVGYNRWPRLVRDRFLATRIAGGQDPRDHRTIGVEFSGMIHLKRVHQT
jgi:hypothetical protein